MFVIQIVSVSLIVGGAALAIPALRATRSTLMTSGAYRLTRNPLYVGLTMIYCGTAGSLLQLWPLLMLPVFGAYISRVVIPAEEARMRQIFGAAYERYCIGVPRWI